VEGMKGRALELVLVLVGGATAEVKEEKIKARLRLSLHAIDYYLQCQVFAIPYNSIFKNKIKNKQRRIVLQVNSFSGFFHQRGSKGLIE
jgi:hypothetical protein